MSEEIDTKAQSLENQIKKVQSWLKKAKVLSQKYQESIKTKSVQILQNHYLFEENAFKSARYEKELLDELKEFTDLLQKFNISPAQYAAFQEIPIIQMELVSFSKESQETLSKTSSAYNKIIKTLDPKECSYSVESVMSHPKLQEEFKNICKDLRCDENYYFLTDIHKYYLTLREEDIEAIGNEIMDKYINENGQFQINITSSMIRFLQSERAKPSFKYSCDFFNSAEKEILKMVKANLLPYFE